MIENKLEKLILKIQNKSLNFDEDDIIILNLYPELCINIYRILADSFDYWKDNLEYILNIEDIIISETMIPYIPTDVADDFWINYIKKEITKENEYLWESLEEFFGVIDIKDETKNQICEMVQNELKPMLNENNIITLINEKKFDLIASMNEKVVDSNCLTEETVNRLLNEFPYDKYDTPIFFASFSGKLEKILDKLSLNTLMQIYYEQEKVWTIYQIPKEKLAELIISKLKKVKLDELGYLNVDLNVLKTFISNEKINEILEITFNNNILDFIPLYYEAHPELKIECCTKFINYIEKTDENQFDEKFNLLISENEIVVDTLIENGFIEELINKGILDKWPTKISKIIENINLNNTKYKRNDIFKLTSKTNNYLSILESLIDSGITKKIYLNEPVFSIEIFLLKMVKKHPEIKIEGLGYILNTAVLENIALEFIKNGEYKKAFNIFSFNRHCKHFSEFFHEHKNLIISEMTKSLYFSSELISIIPTEIFNDKDLLKIYFQEPYLSTQLIDYINHHEEYEYLYNHDTFLHAKDLLASKLQIEPEKLMIFEEIFGPKIIRYIDNENIIKLLNLNEEKFNKFIKLFPKVEYTMKDLEAAYDSLKQYEFSKNNPQLINIFSTIIHAIEDNNEEIINNVINDLYLCLDDSFFKKISQRYENLEYFDQVNSKMFILFIIEKIKNNEGEKFVSIFHSITDYYISKKREENRHSYDMINELKLSYKLNQKSIDIEYLKYLIENSFNNYVTYSLDKNGNLKNEKLRLSEYLARKLVTYGLNINLVSSLLYYNNVDNKLILDYDEDILKANYKYLIKAITEISKEEPKNEIFKEEYKQEIVNKLDAEERIKREYICGSNGIDIYEILTNLRLDVFYEYVLEDEEVYESLKKIMKGKKIHILPNSIKNILDNESIDISDDLINIASFISYYGHIYAKEKSVLTSNNRSLDNININFANILINAEVYTGTSSIYSQILGDEDAKLIKANPKPNSATANLANDGRLKIAVELTKDLFRKQKVTVPTFNECIKISNDKSLRVVIGNFTHPSNLTHGERTGSCMRIGGVGESLFKFAINNPNGFHIRFEDPETRNYISRVTGFRNGNTVFLNELRTSCDLDKYTNEDIIEICKKASEKLIELSKNSTCPIENVVVHRAYATQNMEERNIQLNITNIKEGLPHFYSDVGSNSIVLATAASDKKFVPVNLDKKYVPEYLPAREVPTIYQQGSKARSKIIRIASIKKMLEGENYEYISPLEFVNGIKYAILNEDWYIYVDELGNIYKDCIEIDSRAKEELIQYLVELEKINNLNEMEEVYGIQDWENKKL